MFAENKLSPEAGRLLIAEPFLNDGYFRRAVVLLVEHNEKGSVGFILNKPLDVFVHESIPEFPHFDSIAMLGGPVQRDQLFYLHTLGDKIPGSIPVGNGIWWQGDFAIVKSLIERKEIGIKELRFFIGYSGWEKDQLKNEMEEKSWFVSKPDTDLIFSAPGLMWSNAVKKMGRNYVPMASFPEDPSLN